MAPKAKKKKVKVTGTADVVRFKGTDEFKVLKSIFDMVVPQPVPKDPKDKSNKEVEYKPVEFQLPEVTTSYESFLMTVPKFSRFLNLMGQLGQFFGIYGYESRITEKDFRFQNTHNLAGPVPQFFPKGYNVETIVLAFQSKSGSLRYNADDHMFQSLKIARKNATLTAAARAEMAAKGPSAYDDPEDDDNQSLSGTILEGEIQQPSRTAFVHTDEEDRGVPEFLREKRVVETRVSDVASYFLTSILGQLEDIIKYIKAEVGNDFLGGLLAFKSNITVKMLTFDNEWSMFEKDLTLARREVHNTVLAPVASLIQIESSLTAVEDAGELEWDKKQTLEREFISEAMNLMQVLFASNIEVKNLPVDAIELAEAALFFSIRLPSAAVNEARHVLKDFTAVRLELEIINGLRTPPHLNENHALYRALVNLHNSIVVACGQEVVVELNKLVLRSPVRGTYPGQEKEAKAVRLRPAFPAPNSGGLFAAPAFDAKNPINLRGSLTALGGQYSLSQPASPTRFPHAPTPATVNPEQPTGANSGLRASLAPVYGTFGEVRRFPRIISVKPRDSAWATKRLLRDEVVELTNQLRYLTRPNEDEFGDPIQGGQKDQQRLHQLGRAAADPRTVPVSRLASLGVVNPNISFGLDEVSSHKFASTTAVRADVGGLPGSGPFDAVDALLRGNTASPLAPRSRGLTQAALATQVGSKASVAAASSLRAGPLDAPFTQVPATVSQLAQVAAKMLY